MAKKTISSGTVHRMPKDLREALGASAKALAAWQDLTPLARNEWICWNISVKQAETRKKHIKLTVEQLLEGKRRPCCWYGCIHRKDKATSPSVKSIVFSKRKEKRT